MAVIYTDIDGVNRYRTGHRFIGCRSEPWAEELFKIPIEVSELEWRVLDQRCDSECTYVECSTLNGRKPDEVTYQKLLFRRIHRKD
jgi:hypothetical protein